MYSSIDFNGKNSYKDFGLSISEVKIGSPSKIKNTERVPFSNTVYDFSHIYLGQEYEERSLSFTFNIEYYDNINDFYIYETEVLNWLTGPNTKEVLKYSKLPGYYFLAEVVEGPDTDYQFVGGSMTVNFTAYPFKISELEEGHDIWDEFNFLLDYAQTTDYEVNGQQSITLYNNGASIIKPTIKASAAMEIIQDGITYKIPAGESQSYDFILKKGENKMTVKGNGKISFHFRKELI